MDIVFNICLFRSGLGCSIFKGEIWTAEGYGNGYLDVVEVQTPVTNTWSSGPKLRFFTTAWWSLEAMELWRLWNLAR